MDTRVAENCCYKCLKKSQAAIEVDKRCDKINRPSVVTGIVEESSKITRPSLFMGIDENSSKINDPSILTGGDEKSLKITSLEDEKYNFSQEKEQEDRNCHCCYCEQKMTIQMDDHSTSIEVIRRKRRCVIL